MSSPLLTETPKSQLTAEQPLTKKNAGTYQKRHPISKTKKKPQWDSRRGTTVIKSNPIHARWATHKLESNCITEVLPQEWEFWAPHQAPQPGGLAMGGGVPKESSFESQQGLTTKIPQDWGIQKLDSWRAYTGSCMHLDPGEKSGDFIRNWAWLTYQCLRVSCEGGWGSCGSLWGQGHWRWWFQWVLIGVGPLGGQHFLTKTWPHPTACRLQCWDASGQTTNRTWTQLHPSVDKLLKVFVNKQLPDKHTPDTDLPTRGTRPSSRWAGTSLPSGSLRKPLRQPHPPEGRKQKQEELQPCSLQNRNSNHRKLDKMRWQRNMSQMKKQDKTSEEQLSRDRRPTWKRIQSNDSKDDLRSQKKNRQNARNI